MQFAGLYRIDGSEFGHQYLTRLQAIGHRSSIGQAGSAQDSAANRVERIQAHPYRLILLRIVVYQSNKPMLGLPRIGCVEARQHSHGRRRPRQAPNGLRRQAATFEFGRRLASLAFDAGGKSFGQEQAVGRGNREPQCPTTRLGVDRQAARFRGHANHRRYTGERVEFLDVPRGTSIPPGRGSKDTIETRPHQIAVPRPGKARGPRPQSAVTLAAGRGDHRPQSAGRQETEAQQTESCTSGLGELHEVRSPP
ncbi:MAG: hypothetical protein K2X72_04495 [Reyranella sp.]|nr:hypothetical protein [Reyranella sp.]